MNKSQIIQEIIAAISAEVETYARSAREAHAEATNEQNKAENKYDTRGLEASYLAHGQSRQAAESAQALRGYQEMKPRLFGPTDPIDVGALVELESTGERSLYFLGPYAGGVEIALEGKTVFVITPQAPLARELIGKRQGEKAKLAGRTPGRAVVYRIAVVS